jgi:hypothetical protein
MKTYVFIFVPVQSVPQFEARLRECLASIPDAPLPPEPKKEKEEAYPYWMTFLPNPLWHPKYE